MTTPSSDIPVIVIDGHNLFIRGYVASPRMGRMGEPIGGVTVFLQTLTSLIRQFTPSHCFVAWDTGNGSPMRRSIYKDYKHGRRPKNLNRMVEGQQNETEEEKNRQLVRCIKYLKHLPVKQFFVNDCEADDVIRCIRSKIPADKKMIIVSTDRDYYQMLNDRTFIFNPITKVFVDSTKCLDDFKASPSNVVISRAFLGDDSDNIPGIKGVGPKWIEKHLPMLQENTPKGLHEVKTEIKNLLAEKKRSKVLERVLEEFHILERNWRLMDLEGISLTLEQTGKIDYALGQEEEGDYKLDKMAVIKMMNEDGILKDIDIHGWFVEYRKLKFMSMNEKLVGKEERNIV